MDHCLVFLGAVTQDKQMSQGHLYHQIYNVYQEPGVGVMVKGQGGFDPNMVEHRPLPVRPFVIVVPFLLKL